MISLREVEVINKYRFRVKTMTVLGPVLLIGLVSLSACSTEAKVPVVETITCGWDTSAAGGQAALSAFLTATDTWLTAHQGEIPPAPVSKYWLGDCQTDGVTQGPPIGENDSPQE